HEVGALLEARAVHPGRSARNHLRALGMTSGIGRARVDEVLELVGLSEVAGQRVGAFSLGMGQRLGIAAALLGDPKTLILDEPSNGLDPEGIRWIRDVLLHLAGQGCTVLVSSHLLSEIALMASQLVVIGQGRLIEQCTVGQFVEKWGEQWVRVRSPRVADLARALAAAGAHVTPVDDLTADVRGTTCAHVGELAARQSIVLHELSPQTGSLEDAFLKATASVQDYRSTGFGTPTGPTDMPPPIAPSGAASNRHPPTPLDAPPGPPPDAPPGPPNGNGR
ncbi:MAG: putative transporter ATP-binding protein, partial [Ilumatobacteraceae bacterium]|nr:putative transporter ATP-binding protein [Ilumatobacteraceae bacterium]